MKYFLILIIFILLLILICLELKYKSEGFNTTTHLVETNNSTCNFIPENAFKKKSNIIFNTQQECVDFCSNNHYYNNCDKNICKQKCSQCKNEKLCPFNKLVIESDDVPDPIKIYGFSGNGIVKLSWTKPLTSDNARILFYAINIESEFIDDRLRTDFYVSDEDVCEYTIDNLKNGVPFSINVLARNKNGYSKKSNNLEIVPKGTNTNNAVFDNKSKKFVLEEVEDVIQIKDEPIYDSNGDLIGFKKINYDEEDYIKIYDTLIEDKNNDLKIKNNYNIQIE